MNLSPKKAYSLLLTAKNITNLAYHRWKAKVQDKDEWIRVCKRAYGTTRETKLQSLQFKILHVITPCRKYLRQIRIAEDDNCTQCGQTDDIMHFFFLCPLIKTFWNSIVAWLDNNANINLEHVTPKEAVLGIDDHSSKGKIANFILIHFRFFVHRQRLFHNNKLELLHWLAELRLRLRCMKANLQQEHKDQQFRSWIPLLQALG